MQASDNHEQNHESAGLAARIAVAVALSMLLVAVWSPRLALATQWGAREWRVLPAVSVFMLTTLLCLCIQGAAPPLRFFRSGGMLCATLAVVLASVGRWQATVEPLPVLVPAHGHAAANSEPVDADRLAAAAATSVVQQPNPVLDWSIFSAALLAAIFLGSWLGRGIREPAHFLAFLLCAVIGNAWLAQMRLVSAAGAEELLRLPWPPPAPGRTGISMLEAGTIAALLEAGRGLRLHRISIVLGAVAGFCGGAFLALEPWPNWPVMPALMTGTGVAIAAWPDLKITRRDSLRALVCGLSLLAILCGLMLVRRQLAPERPAGGEVIHYRGTT